MDMACTSGVSREEVCSTVLITWKCQEANKPGRPVFVHFVLASGPYARADCLHVLIAEDVGHLGRGGLVWVWWLLCARLHVA